LLLRRQGRIGFVVDGHVERANACGIDPRGIENPGRDRMMTLRETAGVNSNIDRSCELAGHRVNEGRSTRALVVVDRLLGEALPIHIDAHPV